MNRYLILMRPQQWVKNVLVLAPVFFSGTLTTESLSLAALAFVSFSLLASATYGINDLIDAPLDREHPTKRNRPLASGSVSRAEAGVFSAVLVLLSLGISIFLDPNFRTVLAVYGIGSLLYSVAFKHYVIIDILWLSVLFCLRLLAGVAATAVQASSWIIIATWLLSLMLITGKRYVERAHAPKGGTASRPVLCRYSKSFLRQLTSSAGSLALMCYLLWAHEAVERQRFMASQIFPSGLFVAFGVFRYQFLLWQNQLPEDPTVGLVRDKPLVFAFLGFAIYLALVIYA